MSMTNPTILQLLEKADCRYTLVVEVSKRARQLVDGVPPLSVTLAVKSASRGEYIFFAPYSSFLPSPSTVRINATFTRSPSSSASDET